MNRTLVGTLLLLVLLAPRVGGQDQTASVETLYADVKAKEKAVRTALADASMTPSVLRAVRTVVIDYESLVRNFPASAYSDDALWFAGWLSIDAFERFGQEQERATGTRLWRALTVQYPSSKLARQVPQQLEQLGFLKAPKAASAPPSPALAPPSPPSPPSRDDKAPSVPQSNRIAADEPAPAAPARVAQAQRTPAVPAAPAARSTLATLKGIRRAVLPDVVRITMELDQEVGFQDQRLDGPARVFVDLPLTTTLAELRDRTIRFDGDADLVHQIRIGRHPNNTTRVVLDISGVSSYSVYPLYEPYRLVIDCVRPVPLNSTAGLPKPSPRPAPIAAVPVVTPAIATTPVAPPSIRAAPIAAAPVVPAPAPFPRALTPLPAKVRVTPPLPPIPAALMFLPSRMVAPLFARSLPAIPGALPPRPAEIATTPLPSNPVAQASVPIAPPARNASGAFSMARQLGLSVSRIVIDPGHGGHDPGATGKGVTEASVVLDVALRLEKLLAEVEGVEVILTRRTDDFIGLQERTAIANREGADLFLSIHANASQNLQVHGIETYFLNFATTSTAAAVASRENASSGQTMAALPDFVKAIALNNKVDESREFATYVQRALVDGLSGANKSLRDLGVKQAPFVVLIGASMPSALAEISFLSNSQEVRLIRGPAYRQRIADALFEAIRQYQVSLKNETKDAQE